MELTNKDIDVIICMLDDINDMCGLKPEELELKEKLENEVLKMKLFSIEFEEWIIADNEEKAIDCLTESILANPNAFKEKCTCIKIADEPIKNIENN